MPRLPSQFSLQTFWLRLVSAVPPQLPPLTPLTVFTVSNVGFNDQNGACSSQGAESRVYYRTAGYAPVFEEKEGELQRMFSGVGSEQFCANGCDGCEFLRRFAITELSR